MLIVPERDRNDREAPRAVPPLHKSVGVCLETLLKHRAAAEQRSLLFARHKTGEAGARAGPFLRLNRTRVAAATRWTKAEVGEKNDGEYLLSFNRRAVGAEGETPGGYASRRVALRPANGWLASRKHGGCSDRGVSIRSFSSYVLTELACIPGDIFY